MMFHGKSHEQGLQELTLQMVEEECVHLCRKFEDE